MTDVEISPEVGAAALRGTAPAALRDTAPAVLRDTARARRSVRVSGLVQGVGFRPFVYRLAHQLELSGFVGNDLQGVFVEVEGDRRALDEFVDRVRGDAPAMARVDDVEFVEIPLAGTAGFAVVESRADASPTTWVAPDAAVCDDCLAEMADREDRRYRYPFVTCTNCGPRFTITRRLPYDRPTTTMAGFPLCPACRAEYEDPADRRFHAQPLACPDCGPQLRFEGAGADCVGTDAALRAAHQVLRDGGIVAVKGIGGYHLACDATNTEAVARLRARKRRPGKPFAVMAANLDMARGLARISEAEAALLSRPDRPIVLLPARPHSGVAPEVAPANPRLGVMLPYTPLHHLLFAPVPDAPGMGSRVAAGSRPAAGSRTAAGPRPAVGPETGSTAPPQVLVMTSGNLSGEPLCFEDDDAGERLARLADGFLCHDRPIHVPCDDSVTRLVAGAEVTLRRSRGRAPLPIRLPFAGGGLAGGGLTGGGRLGGGEPGGGPAPRSVLAVGGESKNTFCLTVGADAWLSQHLGDMGNLATLQAFERAVAQFEGLSGVRPSSAAADLHPGYLTSAWAERHFAEVELVQHHHAHLAALMTEHGEPLGSQVLGLVLDGTGYGDDGTVWGCELLAATYTEARRVGHLLPIRALAGDDTVRRPYRAALAWLAACGRPGDEREFAGRVAASVAAQEVDFVRRRLASERDAGTVTSTSAGRLFDAASSLLGVCHEAHYEAQAAIELEHLATRVATSEVGAYPFGVLPGNVVDPTPALRSLLRDRRRGVGADVCSARFHFGFARSLCSLAVRVAGELGVGTVGLSGGVFQNAVLTEACVSMLRGAGLRVLTHGAVPPNDGGLALGQAAVAVARQLTREPGR